MATKVIKKLEDLTPDAENANLGTLRGEQLLERSLDSHGGGRSIVVDKYGRVIAGNKTLQMAIEKGLKARVIKSDGSKLVVVQRPDLDLADSETRVLAYLDNRTSELGLAWDPKRLEADLANGIELGGMFNEQERRELLAALQYMEEQQRLLRVVLEFQTAEQHDQWLRVMAHVQTIEGAYFPDKMDVWLREQVAVLQQEIGDED